MVPEGLKSDAADGIRESWHRGNERETVGTAVYEPIHMVVWEGGGDNATPPPTHLN